MRISRRAAGWLSLLIAITARAQSPGGWVPDASKAAFPARPATGTLFGKAFTPKVIEVRKSGSQTHSNGESKSVALDVYSCSLRSRESIFAEQIADVTLMTPKDKPLDGRTYVRLPGDGYKTAEIVPGLDGARVPWIQAIDLESNVENAEEKVSNHFSEHAFSLRLQFGKRQGETLPGKIYLCVLDGQKRKHFLSGSFTATIK